MTVYTFHDIFFFIKQIVEMQEHWLVCNKENATVQVISKHSSSSVFKDRFKFLIINYP